MLKSFDSNFKRTKVNGVARGTGNLIAASKLQPSECIQIQQLFLPAIMKF